MEEEYYTEEKINIELNDYDVSSTNYSLPDNSESFNQFYYQEDPPPLPSLIDQSISITEFE